MMLKSIVTIPVMADEFPYEYICIEGNIGSGKTTFCSRFAAGYSCEMILEEFTDNPFLPLFYENPGRYGLPVELFFMTERYKQLSDRLQQRNIFGTMQIADYFFDKSLLFARNNLEPLEFKLFHKIYESLSPHIPSPDIMLYLHRPVDQLKTIIKERGRPMEQDISSAYLRSIQNTYFEYFRVAGDFPIIILNAESLDFEKSTDDFEKVIDLLKKRYRKGVHRVSFVH